GFLPWLSTAASRGANPAPVQDRNPPLILARFLHANRKSNALENAQLIKPACTMALRTATRVGSETGTIGSRSVSSTLPSSESAYLTGAGLDSMKRLVCSGISL